jgi:UV DNA damage endonuclease
MRLSNEMFPFASSEEHGYKLAPFAAETLAEVGKVLQSWNAGLRPIQGR